MLLTLRDVGKVLEALYGENPPPIMIIGHSMGGAIAVHTAAANHVPSLLGLCVIDVVEGKFSPLILSLPSIVLHTSKNRWEKRNVLVHALKNYFIYTSEFQSVELHSYCCNLRDPPNRYETAICFDFRAVWLYATILYIYAFNVVLLILQVQQWMHWTACKTFWGVDQKHLNLWRMQSNGGTTFSV